MEACNSYRRTRLVFSPFFRRKPPQRQSRLSPTLSARSFTISRLRAWACRS